MIEEIQKTLFSARVLLVEGTTDQQILQPFFQNILENKEAKKSEFLMEEGQTMVSQDCKTQIILFGGKGMDKAIKFCDEVNIPVLTMRDAEAATFEHNVDTHLRWKCGTIEDLCYD